MNLLIVDDEPDIALMFQIVIRSAAPKIVSYIAFSGDEVMGKLGAYDALLTDLRLGGQYSGHDLAKAYKALRPCGFVAMMTGFRNIVDANADLILHKPVYPEALATLAARLTSLSSRSRQTLAPVAEV